MKSADPAILGELLLYSLIILLPFEELTNFGGMAITKLAGLLFFIVSLVDRKHYYRSIPLVFLAFLLYTSIATCVDILSSSLEFVWLNEIATPVQMCILVIAIYNFSQRNGSKNIVTALYVSSLVYAVAQVFELGGQYIKTSSEVVYGALEDRVSVLGGDPNFVACFVSLSVLAGVIYGFNLVATRWHYRVFALAGSGIGFLAIVKTASRGGLIALLAGVASLVLAKAQWTKRIKYAVFVALLLGAMAAMIMDNPLFKARVLSSIETGETAERWDIWEKALRLSMDSPIYGFGYYNSLFELGERVGRRQKGTHNLFLSVLLGSGFTGLALFLYFYLHSFKTIWLHKSEGRNIIIFGWFMIALASSLSLNIEITKWFWIILALALGAGKQGWQTASFRNGAGRVARSLCLQPWPVAGGLRPGPLAAAGRHWRYGRPEDGIARQDRLDLSLK